MTLSKICPACGNSYGADSLFCPIDRSALVSGGDASQLQGSVVAERYLLSGLLGSGGMGDVYKAQDVRLQRPAAVKLLHAALSADLDALRRFRREGMNASRINSPHVVQVYDAGETETGVPYLAMEFVPGRSLGHLLADEGRLAPGRAVELIGQIAAGLDAAHGLGIVHRDLKPDNVLITRGPAGQEIAKVVDFGISRAIRDEGQQVTKTGFVAGTYEFMSPEQVVGGELTHRADVYALGLIAFMLLTGKLPFPGQTAEHSMLMRLSEAPRTLREICPGGEWDERLQEVFDRALARDPGGRYATAGELASQLGLALAPAPRAAAAHGPGRRRVARSMWVGVAAALAGVGLVLGVRRAVEPRLEPGTRDSLETAELQTGAPRPEPTRKSTAVAPAETAAELSQMRPEPATGAPPANPPSTPDPVPGQRGTTERLPSARAPTRHLPGKARDTTTALQGPDRRAIETQEPPARASAPPADARALLAPFESALHADLPADSIRLALAALDSILPRLRTQRDSVDAGIYRAEAYALAGEEQRACALLDNVWPRATPLQRRKIGLWVDRGLCPRSDWRQS